MAYKRLVQLLPQLTERELLQAYAAARLTRVSNLIRDRIGPGAIERLEITMLRQYVLEGRLDWAYRVLDYMLSQSKPPPDSDPAIDLYTLAALLEFQLGQDTERR